MIPYGQQEINQADIDAVINVLKSDFLTQGPMVPQFEKTVVDYCGAKYGVAVNSATSALHIACLALGLAKDDWLWTSPITFVASANCALYCGAKVDFVDIDPCTYNLSAEALEQKLIQAKKKNRLPKIVVPVHLCGQSCDMEAIYNLSQQYGFKIIEDASHAIGGKYKNEPIGNCRYSDATVFSFHPVKIITTAEGGMVVTKDPQLAEKMALLRSHGITRDPALMDKKPDGSWYYQQIELGFNYRMTDLQAALGISQMGRLDEFISRRHQIALNYNRAFAGLPIVTPWQHPDTHSAMHLYVVRIDFKKNSLSRKDFIEHLYKQGIGTNVHYIPVNTQPYYKKFGYIVENLLEAEKYYMEALSLPMFSGMTNVQQVKIIEVMKKLMKNF
ncbi:UDP-4-amino-4,6-dideoxy-N-acetyl-beta-L-altrosamine transaminase [Legionella israelensis]|uniref:UDP-4-amino-4, 6-dideoxy-N-acetyl-beta-L-altrosamine transaminase n=1 Tax=Legionella israelensis TaxID=454 RepID=UPI00117F5F6C|nr:UDP-4-amino-4,6-dideoxy-N-acetyl-beta-L-altrosamine transaminase [Legionella israelensis]QDP72360.1 UDP-4-amino-4,6-dideoxy-N-acetyl-beta-L-altrosamine transaminase [Legionella israelensis]